MLSFKILANMPICFVSIFENIRGPNAVYTPWEGQGAQAIAAGVQRDRRGDVPCALVGGCDVKTHELLVRQPRSSSGLRLVDATRQRHAFPAKGAAFLVLEDAGAGRPARRRIYAGIGRHAIRVGRCRAMSLAEHVWNVLSRLPTSRRQAARSSPPATATPTLSRRRARRQCNEPVHRPAASRSVPRRIWAISLPRRPPSGGAGARWPRNGERRAVLANCFGYGSEQAAFVLEAA